MYLSMKNETVEYITPVNIKQAEQYINRQIDKMPVVAVTLGSGLGKFVERITSPKIISSEDVPHYPSPSVEGHGGKLIFGDIADLPVLGIQGRSHYYEGRDLREVVFYIDLVHKLGIQYLILTNAAGGVNPELNPGDLVLLDSYLNFTQIKRPFLDNESDPFSPRLMQIAEEVGREQNSPVFKGKYCWTTGPSFETWEEIK